jgi:uncharacterized protein (DUF924 family)
VKSKGKNAMSVSEITSLILTFWFGEPSFPDYEKPKGFWFQSTPQLDQDIRNQFEKYYKRAINGELDDLQQTPEGSLALVIMLDQFPRNMYRSAAQAFGSDPQALEVAKAAVAKGFDKKLLPMQKLFLYLPFEHSERLEDQEKSVELYKALGDKEALNYAIEHYDLIAQFGRFPYRNAVLKRQSTPEEIKFLEDEDSPHFGQGKV